ncbi:MAG: ABC transporter [Candidatus Pelagibacter sp. TMED64]|nr:ABC transporter [Candidatus Pelagibacter sp.]OUU65025.1 MAG: ABC transporter [Candidatus Pelagibacter sp. TMED64]|tara:strand:+ start:2482 stop:3408 length:927 start_codon:yes stop_codon:yes gene_type:complete
MNENNALSINNLNKIYSNKLNNTEKALDNISLEIKQGEIFGLLGQNGAGKTTFLNILSGTVIKNSGKVNVWGFDLDVNPRQVRSSIGIVPQEINLDPFFSPKSILELQAGLFGVPKKDQITDEILKLVSLEKQANAYSRGLSGGMKRRLLIAKALVHQPPILILDEPSAGIDVQLRKELWLNIKSLHKSGVTIILTTHNLYEAQEMCDRIAILKKGKLIALDTTNNLLQKLKTKKITFSVENIDNFSNKQLKNVIFSINKNQITATFRRNQNNIEEIINFLKLDKLKILDISTDNGDLEDVFIQLTKN